MFHLDCSEPVCTYHIGTQKKIDRHTLKIARPRHFFSSDAIPPARNFHSLLRCSVTHDSHVPCGLACSATPQMGPCCWVIGCRRVGIVCLIDIRCLSVCVWIGSIISFYVPVPVPQPSQSTKRVGSAWQGSKGLASPEILSCNKGSQTPQRRICFLCSHQNLSPSERSWLSQRFTLQHSLFLRDPLHQPCISIRRMHALAAHPVLLSPVHVLCMHLACGPLLLLVRDLAHLAQSAPCGI